MHVTNPENKCVEYKISSSYGILKVHLTFLKVQQLSFQYNVKVQNISQIMRNDECGCINIKFSGRNIVYSYNVQVEKYEIVLGEKYEIVTKEILGAPAISRWRLVHWTALNEIATKLQFTTIYFSTTLWEHWIEVYLKGEGSVFEGVVGEK